jgi:hypothetical protein
MVLRVTRSGLPNESLVGKNISNYLGIFIHQLLLTFSCHHSYFQLLSFMFSAQIYVVSKEKRGISESGSHEKLLDHKIDYYHLYTAKVAPVN